MVDVEKVKEDLRLISGGTPLGEISCNICPYGGSGTSCCTRLAHDALEALDSLSSLGSLMKGDK